ncbi:MAG: hypothetical protein DME22_17120 [Verrucomicrobia bacterium]|nr:MAG: hypothetical protein DME22_17120 [Verrucomicrobiota bacterium]
MSFRSSLFFVVSCWLASPAPASEIASRFVPTNDIGGWPTERMKRSNARRPGSNVVAPAPLWANARKTEVQHPRSPDGTPKRTDSAASSRETAQKLGGSPSPHPLDFTPNTNWVDVGFKDILVPQLNPLGQPLRYKIALTNAGPATATSVVLTHPIPVELTGPSATPSQGTYAITNGLLRWKAGTLAAGNTAEISIEATPIAEGGAEMAASITTTEFDYNSMNNSGSVGMPLGVADLAVGIQRPPDREIQAGRPFSLSVTVTNLGPDTSSDATLFSSGSDDFVPLGYALSQGQVIEFREGGIPWQVNFGTLPPFGTARLTLNLIPKQSGKLAFVSSVAGTTTQPDDLATSTNDSAVAEFLVAVGPGIIEFATARTNVWENSGIAVVEVRRHDGAEGTVEVSFSIAVPIINNRQPECNRELSLRLSNATGGACLYGTTNLAVSIVDDDLIPSGELKAASVATNGLNTGAGTGSGYPSISADGRWLVFMSTDGDLVPNDTNGVADVFLEDLRTGQIELLSVNVNGDHSGNAGSALPTISADGRWVVFATKATDIVTNYVPPGTIQTVVRDLEKNTTQLVSVTPDGSGSDGESSPALARSYNGNPTGSISSNGQVVLFYHAGRDLVPGNTNEHVAYFIRDLSAQTTRLVTVNADGTGPATGDEYPEAALSANGRRVVFRSRARDLVKGFNNGSYQVFVRDLPSETTISMAGGPDAGQAVISADGRYVAFSDGVVVVEAVNGVPCPASDGLSKPSNTPSLSADGRFVAFRRGSGTGNVPPNDSQVYVRDCWSNTLALVSVNCRGDGPCNRHARNPVISSDGRYVFFQSFATDLAPGMFDDSIVSLYRRDLVEGKTVLISMNRALTGGPVKPGSVSFSYPALSADGTVAAFTSSAEDLVWGDNNGVVDVFVWRAAYPYASGPALRIDRENTDILLSWPRDATNFVLQSAPDLSGSTWANVSVTGTNTVFRVQVTGRAFFRLQKSQ